MMYEVVVNWHTVKSGFRTEKAAERWALRNLSPLDVEDGWRIVAYELEE